MELFPKEYLEEALREAEREIPLVEEKIERRWLSLPKVERKAIIFVASVLITFALGDYLWFSLLPQLQSAQLAARLRSPLEEMKLGMEKVNEQISSLFTLLSGEKVPPPESASLDLGKAFEELKERVAGAKTSSGFYDFLLASRQDLLDSSGRITQLQKDGVTRAREVETKALLGKRVIADTRGSFLLLQAEAKAAFPEPLQEAEKKLGSLLDSTSSYLSEAEKTANYYAVISDVQVNLVPATVSLVTLTQEISKSSKPAVYLTKVAELSATVGGLGERLTTLNNSLPSGMEKLHQDNLAVFSLLTTFFSETRESVSKSDSSRFDRAITNFGAGLEILSTRAKTYELDFWQKTRVLKDYPQLFANYEATVEELARY